LEVGAVVQWLMLLFCPQAQVLDVPAVNRNPYTAEADLQQGRRLYGGRCAGCHGPGGNGGKGANLAVPSLPRAQTDLGLYKVIRYGIPETEMPPANMTQREIWQIAGYVRMLGASSTETVDGDAARGRQIFAGKGACLHCHPVGTEGGVIGPSLTGIGQRRSPGFLRSKLLDSAANIPDDFRAVEVTTRDGRKVSGIRVNEDTWSIQFRDSAGMLHSFWKQDLSAIEAVRRTPMPSYRDVLDGRDLADMVAYLSGLRGAN
jgi:putative heme-binding domain-containing protein